MHPPAHGEPETAEDCHHRRAAVGDQWQRHADHWHNTRHHGDVDGGIEKNRQGRAGNQQACKLAAPRHRHSKQHHQQHDIQSNQRRTADKAPFFTKYREDEIRLLLGKKIEPALRALHIAFTGESPEPIAIFDCRT